MNISSKKDFQSLVSSLKGLLSEQSVPIKTTRLQELLSHSLGYHSANGLLGQLPIEIELNEELFNSFEQLLAKRHGACSVNLAQLFQSLEEGKYVGSNRGIHGPSEFPKKISLREKYWYLTKDGWISSDHVDFAEIIVGVNAYKVVLSSYFPLFDDLPVVTARTVWTSAFSSYEFELKADELEEKFGDMPDQNHF
jgi:hypothetical protein